jgi:NAD(P)-dependent dehydrogenase (short-subunit alcohol dehydrogenase family)
MSNDGTHRRVWMITGAARGIGAKIADAALAAGDALVATARDAGAVAERLGEGPSVLPLRLDVTDEAQAAAAVEAAVARFGRIDVLINNAGYGLVGAVEEASATDVRRIYETNVFGLLNVTRAVLVQMRRQRSGHIVNISSLGGYRAAAGFGVYSSTKFAVEGLSEALRDEVAPLGIHVTVVEPGYFRTDFLDSTSLVESQHRIDDYAGTAGAVRSRAATLSHQQPGDPDKLATAIVTLVEAKEPPLRLPLGTDAIARIEEKHAFVEREVRAWRSLAASTDFIPPA